MLGIYKNSTIIFVFLIGGCSVHPLPEDMTSKTTIDIVDHVQCEALGAVIQQMANRLNNAKLEGTKELARQFEERVRTGNLYLEDADLGRIATAFSGNRGHSELANLARYEKFSIGFTFDFQINHELKNSGGATFSLPFSSGRFDLKVSGGVDKTRDAARTFKMAHTFADLGRNSRCRSHDSRQNHLYPITGNVGLNETVGTYLTLYNSRGKVRQYSDTLTFTTLIKSGLDPSVEITPVSNNFKLTKANITRSNARKDLHMLTVSLNPPSGSTEGVIKNLVRQEDLDAVRRRP